MIGIMERLGTKTGQTPNYRKMVHRCFRVKKTFAAMLDPRISCVLPVQVKDFIVGLHFSKFKRDF
jgi:hypothetical protein